jgi:hypothetical protein
MVSDDETERHGGRSGMWRRSVALSSAAVLLVGGSADAFGEGVSQFSTKTGSSAWYGP